MKTNIIILLIIFIAMQFITIDKTNEATPKELEMKMPENIYNLVKTACYDCHSNEVKWPWYSNIAPFSWAINTHVKDGRKALNFSEWENYPKEEKEKKIKEIFRTAYAAMPLRSYLWVHKEADLTMEQRKMIRDWTGVRR
ncbi:heme-binding domain-containing protein [Halarcobacter sp.]|uniref:heme-binding domain-containing protein n=1 Tax=Halarcobacter sp. TaxID=2321133 RepID=UPI002AA7803D|nr:heme-binding domain-containing protein [Halarcobacter sp.]